MVPFTIKEIPNVATSDNLEASGVKIKVDDRAVFPYNSLERMLPPLERRIPKFEKIPSLENNTLEKTPVSFDWNLELQESQARELEKNIFAVDLAEASEGLRRIPKENGAWTDEPGNSTWVPDSDYLPKVYNPEEKTWGEILKENGIDGVKYNDGEPDFSEIADATVEIDDFSDSRAKNYAQADERLAEQWNKESKDSRTDWTSDDVAEYREENNMTWHERSDMKTMDLVSSEVHNNIPHSGGISEVKKYV